MVRITEPFHGAVLNHRHGKKLEGGLQITVRGRAGLDERVTVHGAPVRRAGTAFEADVVLKAHETEIAASAAGVTGASESRVRVVWDRNSRPRYRFGIDDNIFFLRDLTQKRSKSLFDCFYLGILRDLHKRYGTKFVVNLFFTTPEEDFTLAQFPADYRAEWADNAGWLKLTFHARAEFPDRPYEHGGAWGIGKDFDMVAQEILRFAGEQTSAPTIIHWAMVHPSAWPELVKRGVKFLSGGFNPDRGSNYTPGATEAGEAFGYDINYGLDSVRSEYLRGHDALKDFASGLVFTKWDVLCNNTPVDQVAPALEALARDPNTAEVMDIFTHEQYFWPFYRAYVPDHKQRCEAAIRWCAEHGYEPVFFHEGFLGVEE